VITTLHDPLVTADGGQARIEVRISPAPGTLAPATVAFQVEPGASAVHDPSVLPMVPAAVVLASRLGQDLRVAEPLPPAVHAGARRVAALLHRWYGWRPAELIAPLAAEPARPAWAHRRRGIGVYFTRGIDSWGALLDRMSGPRRRRPTHLVTLDNEVHLEPRVREAQLDETRRAADRIGLPLIVVRTDIRDTLDPHTDWGTETHGSVLAGVGMLLRTTLAEVVIAPTHWTPLLRPWGSHPELDPAWSLPDLAIDHHDGSEMRWQRVRRVTAEPDVVDSLMVCWQGTGTRNCGRCEKCLRLLTSLYLLGRLDEAAHRFDAPFDPAAVTPDLVVSPHPWCDTIDHLDRVGLAADPLRQRWEQVRVQGRPGLWFQTRPVQPRLPVAVDPALRAHERDGARAALARRLAALGLRIDHEEPAASQALLHLRRAQVDGPASWEVTIADTLADGRPGGRDRTVAVAELRRHDLLPLLSALGLDPGTAVPFRPDGQDPPPVVPEPTGWAPPSDGDRSHR